MDECKADEVQSIKPINVDTVHKICSGQVVLNLAVAVKELVENALDAKAKNIDVKLKNYGLDLIEVSDNGTGITEDNFTALTLKYYTSKISDYSDLLGVSTFGFRGEALSSLCALAKLVITTRHQNSEYATKIEYDDKGNLMKMTPCSRQIGTTVTLSNLFFSLPVRQKELQKNAKREFAKMTQLLYAYCLISLGVKITCTHQTSSNSKNVVVATQGSTCYQDNIACVFGFKQLKTLLEIKPEYVANIKENIFKGLSGDITDTDEKIEITDIEIDLSEDSNDTENDGMKNSQNSTVSEISLKSQGYTNGRCPIQFTGFISSCEHGSGRSSTDKQFYFINSRPCEPVKIIKLVNEVYHQFNPNQYPFVFINIELERSFVDVNVTPDKRKVFLTKEKTVLDVIKYSLLKLFENIPRIIKVETMASSKNKNELEPALDQPRIFNSFSQSFVNKRNEYKEISDKQELKRKSTTIMDYAFTKTMKTNDKTTEYYEIPENSSTSCTLEDYDQAMDVNIKSLELLGEKNNKNYTNIETNKPKNISQYNNDYESNVRNDVDSNLVNIKESKEIVFLEFADQLPDTQIRRLDEVIDNKDYTNQIKDMKSLRHSPLKINKCKIITNKVFTDKEDVGKSNKYVVMKTSLEHVKALTNIFNQQKKPCAPVKMRFRTGINPALNNICEEELSREISKVSFKQMTVIGQFNLGFIIAKLNDDLFIIDQHATDEIYNFETLQKTTELTNQKLVVPQQLDLTGVNEQILMDNLEVFKKNGFSFEIDENALPTKRVKLTALPMSKNWVFGKQDVEELLFMLRESPSEFCRPSRVRAMFASRACRKSVMIGTALSKLDMKTLVDHMAEIEKPWNCPHGRPTIRHLINLAVGNIT